MKIFLAAVEGQVGYMEDASVTIRNGFVSYFGLRNKNPIMDFMMRTKARVKGTLTCDSGAHTFFAENPLAGASASGHMKKTKSRITPDEYFEDYVEFMHKTRHLVNYFVELDIGELVGQDKVEGWRDRLRKEGLYNQVIPCFHPAVMSWDNFEQVCDESESRYLAVEGDRPLQRKGRLDYTRCIKIGMKYNCRIHGFALTKANAMEKYPFYSVDSSSWISFLVYGSSAIIKKSTQQRMIDRKLARTPAGRSRLFREEIDAWNAREDYYTDLWRTRGVEWK